MREALSNLLGRDLPGSFGQMTPTQLFTSCGVPGDREAAFDQCGCSLHPLAEDVLESHVRNGEGKQSATGLALPCSCSG